MSVRAVRFHRVDAFELECGIVLRNLRQAYHLDGHLNEARDNVVVLFHALTGSADAVGEWWPDVVGSGRALDTDRYAVLCPNLLGSCYGTTEPWHAGQDAAPRVTTRDMAKLVHRLVNTLGVRSVALATGASLGGMVALEWAATYPRLSRSVVAFAAPAAQTASAIGWNHIQRRVVAAAGAEAGLEIARTIAMMTYRTAGELERRFGRSTLPGGGFQIEGYLDHHGRKLRSRFDARSYLTLIDAMDTHDVGRGRGGFECALGAFRGRLTGVGIPGDLLYPAEDVRRWADPVGAAYHPVTSPHGHDAFLLENAQVSSILERAVHEAPLLPSRTGTEP
jgi:homoserine O-acetyltransferase/O-succinyltransferase